MGRRSARIGHRAADSAAIRAGALALLGRREYASGELVAALTARGYEASLVATVVAELAGERLVDDARYAESTVRVLAGRGQGPVRIRQALSEVAVGAEQISAALQSGPDWSALAREVRGRKFGASQPDTWAERARQMRFLQYRGFSREHIAAALAGSAPDDAMPAED